MFKFFRKRKAEKQIAYTLYKKLVEQARHPSFYTEFEVEDSIEGRFDMILLHLFLVDDRLEQAGDTYVNLRRTIHEAMVTDLDRSFREIGVGDMSVGKEMKKVGDAWLGRHTVYAKAFADDIENAVLIEALNNNVFGGNNEQSAAELGSYARKAKHLLMLADTETITGGNLVFPEPLCKDRMDNTNKKALT